MSQAGHKPRGLAILLRLVRCTLCSPESTPITVLRTAKCRSRLWAAACGRLHEGAPVAFMDEGIELPSSTVFRPERTPARPTSPAQRVRGIPDLWVRRRPTVRGLAPPPRAQLFGMHFSSRTLPDEVVPLTTSVPDSPRSSSWASRLRHGVTLYYRQHDHDRVVRAHGHACVVQPAGAVADVLSRAAVFRRRAWSDSIPMSAPSATATTQRGGTHSERRLKERSQRLGPCHDRPCPYPAIRSRGECARCEVKRLSEGWRR